MLPGISVDSCSLNGCLFCQHEYRDIIGCLNKESSKDSLLMSFSFCHCKKKLFSLQYFDWSVCLQKHVLINVLLLSPWFHIAKADTLNSKGKQRVGIDSFFVSNGNNSKYHIMSIKHQFIFLFIRVSVVRFDRKQQRVLCAVAHNLGTSKQRHKQESRLGLILSENGAVWCQVQGLGDEDDNPFFRLERTLLIPSVSL